MLLLWFSRRGRRRQQNKISLIASRLFFVISMDTRILVLLRRVVRLLLTPVDNVGRRLLELLSTSDLSNNWNFWFWYGFQAD
jgi:hypothetical protein